MDENSNRQAAAFVFDLAAIGRDIEVNHRDEIVSDSS